MNQTITPTAPKTLDEVKQLNNHITATTHAEAYVEAGKRLSSAGPITSRKLFLDEETKKLVYEYYRTRNKEEKLYVIF